MNNRNIIFKDVFGNDWNRLPKVMKQHYANRAFTKDRVTVEGVMDVELSLVAKVLAPLMSAFGILTPYGGKAVPVTVHFDSSLNDNTFSFNRIFRFEGKKAFHFISRMTPQFGNEIVEFMKCGIGWHCEYLYDGKKVILKHKGYKIKLFGKILPLPISIIIGKGYAEEVAIDDETFKMYMDIQHPILGKIYSYQGVFKIKEVKLSE